MQAITNTSVREQEGEGGREGERERECVCVCVCVCYSVSHSRQARNYLSSLPHYPKKDFSRFFVGANPHAVDLLLKLLAMDPDKRPSAEQALAHPYLAKYHDPEDEVNLSPSLSHSLSLPPSLPLSLPPSLSPSLPPSPSLSLSQPVCDRQYDDSFESMELDTEGWRSKYDPISLSITFPPSLPPSLFQG